MINRHKKMKKILTVFIRNDDFILCWLLLKKAEQQRDTRLFFKPIPSDADIDRLPVI